MAEIIRRFYESGIEVLVREEGQGHNMITFTGTIVKSNSLRFRVGDQGNDWCYDAWYIIGE